MKFGKYLESKARPEWASHYIDYAGLKDLIKEAADEASALGAGLAAFSPRTTSLTVARGAATRTADERFYEKLETEMAKVNRFTVESVSELKKRLKALRAAVSGRGAAAGGAGGAGASATDPEAASTAALLAEAKTIGDEFLALEKYVNLNYLGFHKATKKWDKNVPHAPCSQFYVAHLHGMPWVQGNYSTLLVQLSHVYSVLRGDTSGTRNEDASQGFVRSTTKYWVRHADVSAVKHAILQHLPVFVFAGEGNEDAGDSQLINSAYFDNSSLELYHGRLDKRPGAIAVRIRWYGEGPPKLCFVERKTHRESWKGEESVKERFTLPEPCVVPFLEGKYTVEDAAADLRAKGKSEEEVAKFVTLASEVYAQVDAKQLTPTCRTAYWRTAFQIPYDSTVRISLDTNLIMMKENPDDGPTCADAGHFFRDPSLPVPRTEVTRFPHAVLEVKLSLPEGQQAPEWVADLIESGYLVEVNKFSKFCHGVATLMPDMVQAVPYWVDDESVRPSMLQSAPAAAAVPVSAGVGSALARAASGRAGPSGAPKPRRRGADDEITHPLLGDAPILQLLPPRDAVGFGRAREATGGLLAGVAGWWFGGRRAPAARAPTAAAAPAMARTTPMRIEPKTFLANERTFLSWLHMAVTVGSIAAALIGFAGSEKARGSAAGARASLLVEIIALILLPVSVAMIAYALCVFVWRSRAIGRKQVGYIDDRRGPLALSAVVIVALTSILIVSIVDGSKGGGEPPAPAPPPPAVAAAVLNATARLVLG